MRSSERRPTLMRWPTTRGVGTRCSVRSSIVTGWPSFSEANRLSSGMKGATGTTNGTATTTAAAASSPHSVRRIALPIDPGDHSGNPGAAIR
jgi:hypothetical protein